MYNIEVVKIINFKIYLITNKQNKSIIEKSFEP